MQIAPVLIGMLFAALTHGQQMPSILVGHWIAGAPYDLRQPIGFDATQEVKIRNLKIKTSKGSIEVCGKVVPIKSLKIEHLSPEQFLERYNFSPNNLHLLTSNITEVTVNELHSTNACGDFEDPGTHLFVSGRKVVMETGNDYFPLERRSK